MKHLLTYTALILGGLSALDTSADQAICTKTNEEIIFTQQRSKKSITLKTEINVCQNGYQFISSFDEISHATLLISPTELGPDTKYTVYHVSFDAGEIKKIGELPVSANVDSSGIATSLHQEGGSIYLQKFKIDNDKLEIFPKTLELVTDGSVCLDDVSRAWSLEVQHNKSCKKTAKASYKNPICLIHEESGAMLHPKSACREVEMLLRGK